jgi:VWFA-related protein
VILALAVLVAPGIPLWADEPERGTYQERAEVSLHLIDVCVTDRKGRPIAGLDRDSFVLRIDDREREIVSVDASRLGGLPGSLIAPPEIEPELRPEVSHARPSGLWVLIGLDADRISSTHRTVALDTARALVEQGGQDDRFAVAVIRRGGTRLVQDFAPPSRVNLNLFDNPSLLHTTSSGLRNRIDELDELIRSCTGTADPGACVFTRSAEFGHEVRRESWQGVEALSGLISAMAAIPGRKAFVLFSDGIVLSPGDVVLDAVRRYTPEVAERLQSRLQDPSPIPYDRLVAEATRSGVTFFSMRTGRDLGAESRGVETGSLHRENLTLANDPFRTAQRSRDQSLRVIAEATGGRAVLTPLGARVADGLLDRLGGVYTLAARVIEGDGPGSRVKVALSGSRGKVQVAKRLPAFAAPREPLSVTIEATEVTTDDFAGRVHARLSVPLSELGTEEDEETGARTSRVAVFARLLDSEGQSTADSYRILEIPRGGEASRQFVHGLVFRVVPGRYIVQVSVSDLVGGGVATDAVVLDVSGRPGTETSD